MQSFGIQLNPLQKQRSNPVGSLAFSQQATRQNMTKSCPSDYAPQHQSTRRPWKQPSAESGHNETHLPTWDNNPGGKVLWQTAEVFCWFFAKWKVPPNLSWCKCKWSEMHVNVFTMIHKSVTNTTYVLFKSFKYLSVPRLSASCAFPPHAKELIISRMRVKISEALDAIQLNFIQAWAAAT